MNELIRQKTTSEPASRSAPFHSLPIPSIPDTGVRGFVPQLGAEWFSECAHVTPLSASAALAVWTVAGG